MHGSHHFSGTGDDHLALVLAVGNIGIWELDTRTQTAWRNPRHDEIFGYPDMLENWTYEQFLDHVVPEDRSEVDTKYGEALRDQRDWAFECRIERADGARRWIAANGKPLFDENKEIYALIGHVIDITDNKRNEEHLRLVTNELNHRVRNMLAMTKAMVNLSTAGATDIASFARSIEGRVSALARAHDLIARRSENAVPLRSVIETELSAFSGFGERIRISGSSDRVLEPENAERFALILHELITNAIKYGALSNDTGTLLIAVQSKGNEVEIEWAESGGPPVEPPTRQGFGSTLLKRVLGSDGAVDIEYPNEGVRCLIRLPVGNATRSAVCSDGSDQTLAEEQGASMNEGIAGRRIMVLEDEPLIALNHEDTIAEACGELFGNFASCAEALAALNSADDPPDSAVLDINLSGETSAEVAERLAAIGVPFIFTTGYGKDHELLHRFPRQKVVQKPAQPGEIVAALASQT